MTRIGYLVPEFPGQTHNFFWREIQSLRARGVDVRLISTRRPPQGLLSTSWGPEAMRDTAYLFPFTGPDWFRALWTILRAGPAGWLRCLAAIAGAEGETWLRRARMSGLLLMAGKLVSIARAEGWRHVHVHSCADAANIAFFASRISSMTYSLTLHTRLAIAGGNQRQKWRHASFAIVVARILLEEVRKTLGDDVPPQMEVAPMGVDASIFARTAPYRPYEGRDGIRVFSCARLNPGKGHRFLIEATGRLRGEGLPITLEIAGEDDLGGRGHRIELQDLIRSLGLENYVMLLGAVPEEMVRSRLMAAHVFALATLDEALGVAIMEAMAMEMPVVATQVGGVSELVSHGQDGLLVPPSDPDALAQAIKFIVEDPVRAQRFGRLAREKVRTEFSTDRSAEAMARLLPSPRA